MPQIPERNYYSLEEPDSSSEESESTSESDDDIETEIIPDIHDELNDFSIEC